MHAVIGAAHWSQWALDNAQSGFLILNQDSGFVYANRWFLDRVKTARNFELGIRLTDVLPELTGSYFETVLSRALINGFPVFLSNSLHASPFPLFQSVAHKLNDTRIKQSVHILPMSHVESESFGQRYVLIQISDVTQSVNREKLLKAQAAALHGAARSDALTGIGNRRSFDEVLAMEVRQANRNRSPISLIFFDIDNFKLYNDQYGHVRGDEALTLIADAARRTCHRPRDLAARYGGEEIALVLPETNLAGALKLATELQKSVKDLYIEHIKNLPAGILTVSIGVVAAATDGQVVPKTLIEQADLALYKAKESGRDCIFFCDGTTISRFK